MAAMKDSLRKYAEHEEEDDQQLTFSLRPLLLAIFSPSLLRLSLTGILFLVASFALAGASVVAYAAFYYSYIPHPGFTRPLYLQYDVAPPSALPHLPLQTHSTTEGRTSIHSIAHTSFPYAIVPLAPGALVANQPYAVTVHLDLPRTPTNLHAGNFMLDLALLQPSTLEDSDASLVRARRPAMLTYRTGLHEQLHRLLSLPLLLLGVRSESEHLDIRLFEYLILPRGGEMPAAVRLEVQSPLPLQVTGAHISFRAEFRGLRKLMRNHRIFSTLLFSASFFAVAESVLVLICLGLGVRILQQRSQSKHAAQDGREIEGSKELQIKAEQEVEADDEGEGEDAEDEFGTPIVKKEDDEGAIWVREMGRDVDSGIGTSLESSGGVGSVRRRASGRG